MKSTSGPAGQNRLRREFGLALILAIALGAGSRFDQTARAADPLKEAPAGVDVVTTPDTVTAPDSLAPIDSLILDSTTVVDSLALQLELARLDSIQRADSLARALEAQSLYLSGILRSPADGRWWTWGDSGFVAGSPDGDSWQRFSTGNNEMLLCADWWQDHLLLGGRQGRIYDFVAGSLVKVTTLDSSLAINDISLRPDGNGLCVGDEGLVGKTGDGGASWERIDIPYYNRWYQVEPHGEQWLLSGSGGLLVTLQADTVRRQFQTGGRDHLRVLTVDRQDILLGHRGRIDRLTVAESLASLPLPRNRQQVYDIVTRGDTLLAAVFGGLVLLMPEEELFLPLHQRYLVTSLALHAGTVLAVGTHGRAWSVDLEDSLRVTSLETGARKQAPTGVEVAVLPTFVLPDSALAPGEVGEPKPETEEEYIFDPAGFRYGKALDRPIIPSLTGGQLSRKVNQLNDYAPLNVGGLVLMKVYISHQGELVDQQVLAEYPICLGYRHTAERVLRSLSFEPALCGGAAVDAWMFMAIPIDTTSVDYGFIMNGDLRLHHQLREMHPEFEYPQMVDPVEEKARRLRFPGRAKRFLWRGEAIVEYDLDTAGQASNFAVTDETAGDFEFGGTAIEYLQDMEMTPARLNGETVAVHVIHHVIFDRKRKVTKPPGFFKRLFGGGEPDTAVVDSTYLDKPVFVWPQLTETRLLNGDELIRHHYCTPDCDDSLLVQQLEIVLAVEYGGNHPAEMVNIVEQSGDPPPGDLFEVIGDLHFTPGMQGRLLHEPVADTLYLRIDTLAPDSCRLHSIGTLSIARPSLEAE